MKVCSCSLAGTRACMSCSNGSMHTITYPFDYEYFKEMLEYNRKFRGYTTSSSGYNLEEKE